MDMISGESNPINTSAIKQPEAASGLEVRTVSPSDFQNFTYTGISVEVPTPIVKVSSEAMFAINIDGFIPNLNWKNFRAHHFRNFFPVQIAAPSIGVPGLAVNFEYTALPVMTHYLSHRHVEGDVGIALRITSNTAQSGNFMVAQVSGVSRYYYKSDEKYTGLRFIQDSMSPIDYAPNGFALVDLSLNRHFAITPCRRDNTIVTDFAQKLIKVPPVPHDNTYLPIANQFLEDWLIFAPQTNIPHPDPSSINIAIYFDWSRVKFHTPMLPFIPWSPSSLDYQILHISDTFNHKTEEEVTLNYANWRWSPGSTATLKDLKHAPGASRYSAPIKLPNGSLASVVHTTQQYFKQLLIRQPNQRNNDTH